MDTSAITKGHKSGHKKEESEIDTDDENDKLKQTEEHAVGGQEETDTCNFTEGEDEYITSAFALRPLPSLRIESLSGIPSERIAYRPMAFHLPLGR